MYYMLSSCNESCVLITHIAALNADVDTSEENVSFANTILDHIIA